MKKLYSLHLGYLFTELPFPEQVRQAAKWGFAAVEHPSPYNMSPDEIVVWLTRFGIKFAQLAAPAGDAAIGEKGIAIFPDRINEFRKSVRDGLDFASRVGCKLLHIMAGIRPLSTPPSVLWPTYLDNLAFAAECASDRNISLLIEPIGSGTIADYFVDHPAIAVDAIDTLGHKNVGILVDTFHLAGAGLNIPTFIKRHGQAIRHLQIADYPGRHEPGSGAIDFPAIYEALDSISYSGFIGCEYIPRQGTANGLSWLAESPFSKPTY